MNDITNWWNELSQNARWAIRDSLIVVAGLCAGLIAGRIVKRVLVRRNIDRYLQAPWKVSDDADQSILNRREPSLLTSIVGWLVTLTVWTGTAGIIGWLRHVEPVADFSVLAITRGWQIAIIILVSVLAGGWLAHNVYGLFQTPWLKRELDGIFPSAAKADGTFSDTAARALCIFIYAAFLLFVPVAIAGLFNFASFAPLVAPAWHLCARLLTVPVAFAVGYLGLAWVRSQSKVTTKDGVDHSELEYYVGLGIMIGTTVFALALLLGVSSGAGAIAIVALVCFLVMLFWPVRKHLRDIWAGFLLRLQKVKTFLTDDSVIEIHTIGLLMTTLSRNGEESLRKNTEVLAEVLKTSRSIGSPKLPLEKMTDIE
jgi:hypothetical protein